MNIKQLFTYFASLLMRKILHKTIYTSIALTQPQQVMRTRRRTSYLVPKIGTNLQL